MIFDDMLADVLVDAESCPTFLAITHLRKAARRFCEGTHLWTVTLADISTVAGTGAYALQVPAQSSPVRLARVNVGDERDVDILELEDAKAEVDRGRQSSFAWLEAGQLHIGPTPARAVPVSVQLSLKPTATAEGLPDWIVEDHLETLVEGAKASLLALPGKDWTNPGAAATSEAVFSSALNGAAINKTKGRARTRGRRSTFY